MTPAGQLSRRRPQDGYALVLVLAALGVGVLVLAAGALGQARGTAERDAATAAALQHARQALLGYAAGYRDNHPGEVFGYLPLPDLGSSRNPLVPYEGVAAGNFSGNQKNLSVIGRLPWRTLGVPPVRDGYGECLWYAVSGSHQNVQKADVMNWDSVGHFEVFASDGTPGGARRVTGADEHQRPVAVIFAAGPPLAGQSRQTSNSDDVSECGGNYDVRNYLDTVNATAQLDGIVNHFPGSPNSATANVSALASPKALIGAPVRNSAEGTLVSDRALVITPQDIFGAVKRRADFTAAINALLADVANCLVAKGLPSPDAPQVLGAKLVGGVPASVVSDLSLPGSPCPNSLGTGDSYLRNWRDQFLYASCLPAGQCITVNGSACGGALIFAGERSGGQRRAIASDRSSSANYLEGENLSTYAQPLPPPYAFAGANAFSLPNDAAMPASQDVVLCLNAVLPPPGGPAAH
jgi:hypothetical protein